MKTFSIRVVALAASALVTGGAYASINLDTGVTSASFASEFNYSSTSAPLNPITGAKTITTKLGFGVSGGQNRYIRVDMVGATLAAASIAGNVPVNGTAGSGFSNSVLVAGGAVGNTYAIYQVTADATNGASPTDAITIALPNLYITNGNAANVTVTYTLYETATAAVANLANTNLYQNSGALIKFTNALKWVLTPSSQTAAVSTLYKQFVNGATTTLGPVALGSFVYGVNAAVKADGATAVALTDLVTAATNATFAGDFTAAGALFIDNNNACGSVASAVTLNGAKTSGSPATALGTTATTANLCYTVTGATVIPVVSETAALTVVPAANSAAASVAAAKISDLLHDGTQLQAPLVQTTGAYVSRFILTNTGTTAADYTGIVTAGPGSTVTANGTLTGTVPAGGSVIIEGAAMPTFGAGGPLRGFAVFTVAGPNNNIQGVYQITNISSGAVSNTVMVRPGTN